MILFLHDVFSHEISEDDDIFGFTTYDFESEESDSEADITVDADQTVRALNSRSITFIFSFFLVIPGARLTPSSLSGNLDASLRPGGGVWGCLGSKLWWGSTGI